MGGDYLIPGYFDPHTHVDLLHNPASFSDQVVVTGTTAVLADNHDVANSLGPEGLRRILRDVKSHPLTFYVGLLAVSPPFPDLEGEGDILSPESSSIPPGSSIYLNPIPSTSNNSIPVYDWIF